MKGFETRQDNSPTIQELLPSLQGWVKELEPRSGIFIETVHSSEHLAASKAVYDELNVLIEELQELEALGATVLSTEILNQYAIVKQRVKELHLLGERGQAEFNNWSEGLLEEVDSSVRRAQERGDWVIHFVEEGDLKDSPVELQRMYSELLEIESSIKRYLVLAKEKKIRLGGMLKRPKKVLLSMWRLLSMLVAEPDGKYAKSEYQKEYELLQELLVQIDNKVHNS